jgi:hypothetical protein
MKKILKYIGYGLIAFTILGIIAVATDTSKAEESTASNGEKSTPVNIPYTVADKKTSGSQLDYKITINDRVDKEALIEIIRKLKQETEWKENLVCFFYIREFSISAAWASCAYLPECGDCMKDKDADGNPVEFRLIGLTRSDADNLKQLKLDTIANKTSLGSWVEDTYKCKTEAFIVNNNSSKILLAQIFTTGNILQWLKLKKVDGEKRYYFDDEEPGKENYMVFDEAGKKVHYKDYEDKTWMSYGIE